MISVVIADDHLLVAESIAHLVQGKRDICVKALAANISDAVKRLAEMQPDVLLLDIAMPDGNALDQLTCLAEASADTRIVVLTTYAEPAVIQRALANNVGGYVLKSEPIEVLLQAIADVASGLTFVCPEARRILAQSRQEPPELTIRERQVLKLIVEGYSIKQIADKLCLGFETVHSYTKNLRQKLGCGNMASVVREAIRQRLV